MSKSIGAKVKAARLAAEMTREEFAKKLGLSIVYTGGIERDADVILSVDTVAKLKKVLPNLHLTEKEVELKNEASRRAAADYRKKRKGKSKKAA